MTTYNGNDFATYKERDKAAEKLMSLDGWRIEEKIEILEVSIFIFSRNFEELMESIELFKDPSSLILHDVRNTKELRHFLKEVTRLLHNYLAAAMTLVDHTRILVRELYNEDKFAEFNAEYSYKIKEIFAENPLHQFVQDLRNYIIHKKLPMVGSTLNLNEIQANLIVDLSELRKNFKWRKYAKEFLDSKGDDEKLEILISDYFNLVYEFHKWFYNRQLEIHAEEFREADELRERIAKSRWTF
jgi:hypothetical protein